VDRVVRIRERDVPQVALAYAERLHGRSAGEAREVEGVALEAHDGRIETSDFEPLHAAGDQHQEGAGSGLDDLAMIGDRGDALLRVRRSSMKMPRSWPSGRRSRMCRTRPRSIGVKRP